MTKARHRNPTPSPSAPADAQNRLEPLFAPRGIAVIGASQDPNKMGSVMARSLGAFDGPVLRINSRNPKPQAGLHESVAHGESAIPIDLAILCVPPAACASALEDAAKAGVRAAVVCAGGFSEAGVQGAAFEKDLASIARQYGVSVLGPNTSGFIAPHRNLTASFVPAMAEVDPGGIAIVASSGGVHHALAFMFTEAGYGIRLGVGLGNSIDVASADVLDFLCHDPGTTAVALHLETIADAHHLLSSVRRLARRCPIVALVVGKNDVGDFAASHTGALATGWRTVRAALRQQGVVLVEDERQLIDAVGALSVGKLLRSTNLEIATNESPATPDRRGIGVITGQAGPGLLILDGLRGLAHSVPALGDHARDELSKHLPPLTFQANPVDTGRPGSSFADVITAVATDPGVDAIGVYSLFEPDAVDLSSAVSEAATGVEVPIVVGIGGYGEQPQRLRNELIRNGVAASCDPTGVINGLDALVMDAERHDALWYSPQAHNDPTLLTADPAICQQPVASSISIDGPVSVTGPVSVVSPVSLSIDPAFLAQPCWTEEEAKTLLDQVGVHSPKRVVVTTADEALAAFNAIDTPIVLKVLDGEILHKTDVNALLVGLHGADQVSAGFDELATAFPGRRILVEAMAPGGVDLMVSAFHDPVFGPMVALALGGITAELEPDITFRLAPLSSAEARGMKDDLVGRDLLQGWRKGPTLNNDALADLIVTLGDLLRATPEFGLIEINPLRLIHSPTGGSELVALDAVIVRSIDTDPKPPASDSSCPATDGTPSTYDEMTYTP